MSSPAPELPTVNVHLGDIQARNVPVGPVLLVAAGFYLAWFAWKNFGTGGWPSTPIKEWLQGPKTHLTAKRAGAGTGKGPGGPLSAVDVFEMAVQEQAAPGAGTGTGTGAGGATTGGKGTYTHGQLENLWRMAGGSPSSANVAAAIAQAESSGNPRVTSPNPDGGTNVGLWQLDTKGKGAGFTVAQLQTPLINARAAVSGSSDGRDWSAWATFASGAYKQFLAPAGQTGKAVLV